MVDNNTGAIRFKKWDVWINSYNPVLSAALRCNTDVTCLLSGTQVRAIIAYVTDYVTKGSLTTHTFFQTVRSVLQRNTELLDSTGEARISSARSLITKFINTLSAASEVGGPAASAHLLGLSDHYTDHIFKTFFWKGYVRRALEGISTGPLPIFPNVFTNGNDGDDRVVLGSSGSSVIALSKVNDYVFRPRECAHMCLYDFLCRTDVRQRPKSKRSSFQSSSIDEEALSESDYDLSAEHDVEDSADSSPRAGASFAFLGGHPLSHSHEVRMRRTNMYWTLNFTGGMLPRLDRGVLNFQVIGCAGPGMWTLWLWRLQRAQHGLCSFLLRTAQHTYCS
ncbi:hypothetical protein C8Q73DRAFT_661081 [Cubamyces lactineus]|nr:hypothetical protein C8Q73DRAFT_661081 [Cubamyces lactineus]